MKIRSLCLFMLLFLGFNSSQSLLGRIGSGDFRFKNNTAFRIEVKYCQINNLKNCGKEVVEPKSTGQKKKWGFVSVFVKEIKFQDLEGNWEPALNCLVDRYADLIKVKIEDVVVIDIDENDENPDSFCFGLDGCSLSAYYDTFSFNKEQYLPWDFIFENQTGKLIKIQYGINNGFPEGWFYEEVEIFPGNFTEKKNWDNKQVFVKSVKEKRGNSWKEVWAGNVPTGSSHTIIKIKDSKFAVNGKK